MLSAIKAEKGLFTKNAYPPITKPYPIEAYFKL
jgi:hypothetical protein